MTRTPCPPIGSSDEELVEGAAGVLERGGNTKSSALEVDIKSLRANTGKTVTTF
jgi:hypothetical protein